MHRRFWENLADSSVFLNIADLRTFKKCVVYSVVIIFHMLETKRKRYILLEIIYLNFFWKLDFQRNETSTIWSVEKIFSLTELSSCFTQHLHSYQSNSFRKYLGANEKQSSQKCFETDKIVLENYQEIKWRMMLNPKRRAVHFWKLYWNKKVLWRPFSVKIKI